MDAPVLDESYLLNICGRNVAELGGPLGKSMTPSKIKAPVCKEPGSQMRISTSPSSSGRVAMIRLLSFESTASSPLTHSGSDVVPESITTTCA